MKPRASLKVAPIHREPSRERPGTGISRLPDALRQEILRSLLENREDQALREPAKRWCSLFQQHDLTLSDALSAILSLSDPPFPRELSERFLLRVSREWVGELEHSWQHLIEEQTVALQQVNQQLRKVDRSRAEFVSTLSHELRTPLTAIFGGCELLLEDFELPSDELEFVQLIQHSAEHIRRLIEDVLDFSKLEAGKLELNLETVEPALLLEGVFELVTPLLRAKKLRFTQPESGLPPLLADPIRLSQILLNLLSNAIKFTPEGGHVTVRTELAVRGFPDEPPQPMLAIEVIDDGIGIPPEHQAEIFERFRQVRNHRGGQRGTGLGLPISRFLVELHGGSIEVKSKPGEGSLFRFTIPLAP